MRSQAIDQCGSPAPALPVPGLPGGSRCGSCCPSHTTRRRLELESQLDHEAGVENESDESRMMIMTRQGNNAGGSFSSTITSSSSLLVVAVVAFLNNTMVIATTHATAT